MSDGFVVQKGAAVPAARFRARRTIMLPAINLHATSEQSVVAVARGRTRPSRVTRLNGTGTTERRKFTFRIDAARHAEFCRMAESRNVSRQRLLTEALDALLHRAEHTADAAPTHLEDKQALHSNRITPHRLDIAVHRT